MTGNESCALCGAPLAPDRFPQLQMKFAAGEIGAVCAVCYEMVKAAAEQPGLVKAQEEYLKLWKALHGCQ